MTTPTPTTLATHDAWLSARRIGGSDVAAILGLSPYRTGWDVYERLVEGHRQEASNPAAAARGHALEPTVLRGYTQATGRTVERPPPFTLWTRDDWATASVDGLADRRRRVVEAKTDRDRSRWGEPCTIERWTPEAASVVRRDYYLQVAHYMHVLDVDWADLAVLVPGEDPFVPELRVFEVRRDLEVEEVLVEQLRAWWLRHVVGREPPPMDGSHAAGRHLARRARSGSRPATSPEVALAAQYAVAKQHADAWEHERRRVGQLLVDAAGDAARLDLPVGRVTVVRSDGRATLDERALLAERPDLAPLLERFRRPGAPYTYPLIAGLESSR